MVSGGPADLLESRNLHSQPRRGDLPTRENSLSLHGTSAVIPDSVRENGFRCGRFNNPTVPLLHSRLLNEAKADRGEVYFRKSRFQAIAGGEGSSGKWFWLQGTDNISMLICGY